MDRTYRIAAIPGDGIGKEVMPEDLRTDDLGRRATTVDIGRAIAERLAS